YETDIQQTRDWKGPATCWCLKSLKNQEQCDDCKEILKDVCTYQYYRNSMEIQSTYKVQIEEND
ncbi:12439_t:CDS:1, partial [Funneliformis geosporum]